MLPGTQLCLKAFDCCNCIHGIPKGVAVPTAEVLLPLPGAPVLLQVRFGLGMLTLSRDLPSIAARRRQELQSGDGNLVLV